MHARRGHGKSTNSETKNEIDFILTNKLNTTKIVAALNKPKSSDHSIVRWQGNDRLKKRRREVIQNEMAKYHNSQREIR